jgi:hypothetical protein
LFCDSLLDVDIGWLEGAGAPALLRRAAAMDELELILNIKYTKNE